MLLQNAEFNSKVPVFRLTDRVCLSGNLILRIANCVISFSIIRLPRMLDEELTSCVLGSHFASAASIHLFAFLRGSSSSCARRRGLEKFLPRPMLMLRSEALLYVRMQRTCCRPFDREALHPTTAERKQAFVLRALANQKFTCFCILSNKSLQPERSRGGSAVASVRCPCD
jgi:hypothetical protein